MTAQGHTQVSRNKNNCVKGLVGHLKGVLFLEQLFKGENVLRLFQAKSGIHFRPCFIVAVDLVIKPSDEEIK